MTRIFWDTHLFLYLFEGGAHADEVRRLRERMIVRRDRLFTSSVALGEMLVRPLGVSAEEAAVFEGAVTRAATILPFDSAAAGHYARLRGDRSFTGPDAIQLACAASAGIDMFITNDDRLASQVVPGIKFITPLSRAFL
jgi:predicted nucleic acid-binding protein